MGVDGSPIHVMGKDWSMRVALVNRSLAVVRCSVSRSSRGGTVLESSGFSPMVDLPGVLGVRVVIPWAVRRRTRSALVRDSSSLFVPSRSSLWAVVRRETTSVCFWRET